MIGDASDIVARLKRVMPRWFGQDQGETPVLDALLGGPAVALEGVHALYEYARLQTRIASATGAWLDLIALDFFAGDLVRSEGQSDGAFRLAIVAELFRPKATRPAISLTLEALTGLAPRIFEPTRALDTGGYDLAGGYDSAGGWGSYDLPAQAFVTVKRPHLSGIANVSGFDLPFGGFDTASPLQWAPNADFLAVADAMIYRALDRVRPAGVTLWVRIVDSFDNLETPGAGSALNFPGDWTHRAPIVIQESHISGASALTNFPVLLVADCVPPAFLDTDGGFQVDGGDIRFSADEAGLMPIPCEIVSFAGNATPANATCEIWVKVPSVAADIDTTIYMWRRSGTGVTQPEATAPTGRNAVWSDYLGVWHCDDLTDATGNGNDLTAVNGATMNEAEAAIGLRSLQCVRASTEYFHAGSPALFDDLTAMTVQCWMRPTANLTGGQLSNLVSKTLPSGDTPWQIWADSVNEWNFLARGGNTSNIGFDYPLDEWRFTAAGYGVATGADSARFYRSDNAFSFDRGSDPHDDAGGNLTIGYAEGGGAGGLAFDGQVDEVRLRGEYLSVGWMAAEYEMQAFPALFAIPGAVSAL